MTATISTTTDVEAEVAAERTVAELVLDARDGDATAWAALMRRFDAMVHAVARGHRLCAADVSDVAQTTWLRLFEHLHRIDSPERVGAWLATTARRESLKVLRRSDREVTADGGLFSGSPAALPELDADVIRAESDATVRRAFACLPARAQTLLGLLIGDTDLSYKEVSAELNMPIGSIGPTRQRCLESLRQLIEAEDVHLVRRGLA
jgi:RNA polymerase sigma factor (sigma-70 family)